MTEVQPRKSLGQLLALTEKSRPAESRHRSQTVDQAQWFVDHEISVVPTKGKMPIGGVYSAKLSTKGITNGYGIALGSGLIGIDYDIDEDPEKLRNLLNTRFWRSGSQKGFGVLYRVSKELSEYGGVFRPGITLRGCGSILVGPGSLHPSGGIYTLIDDIEIQEAPDWVIATLELIRTNKEKESTILLGKSIEPHTLLKDKRLQDKLEADSVEGTRSEKTYELLAYACERGGTNEELAWLISNFKPAIDKGNVQKDLARILNKLRTLHDHTGKPCDQAKCPNKPTWMSSTSVSTDSNTKKQPSINLLVEPFSNMKKEIFAWYDEPWIPQIGLALVAGPSGAGKSTYLVYQIAKLTRQKIKCLYLGTREQDGSRIRAQLEAADADLDYVFSALMEETHNDMTFKTEVQFKRDLDILSKVIVDHGIKAVFLDPGNSYIGISEGNDTSGALRLHLERLKRLCEDLKITIVFLKHTKKQQKDDGNIPIGDMIYGDTVWKEVPRINTMLWPVKDKLRERLELSDDDPTNVLLLVAEGHNYADKNHPAAQFHLHAVFDNDLQTKVTKIDYLGCKTITTSEIDDKKGQSDKEAKESKKVDNELDSWVVKMLKPHREKGLSTEILRKLAGKDGYSWNNIKVRVNRGRVEVEKIPIEGSNEVIWKLPLTFM